MSTVQELVARSKAAQKQFEFATQEQADAAAKVICKVVYDNAQMLGAMAVEESRMGNVGDKIAKCRNKSMLIWQSLKGKKTVGVINRLKDRRMLEIAKPMGVVAAIIPSTNPVVTPMGNAASALKTRNSIIFAPHPRAVKCTKLLVEMFQQELEKIDLPKDLILGLEQVSVEDSGALMSMADVVVATGGPGMVKAAYSSGKPSLGVGQGNVQCIVDRDADLGQAAEKILIGRSFDNGLICLGEQTAFVPEEKFTEFVEEMKKHGGYYVDGPEQVAKLREGLFPGGGPISRDVVGLTAAQVGALMGFNVPEEAKAIVVKADGIGRADYLCREKLCPVITVYPYKTFEEGVAMMVENLEYEGKGHSIAVHSNTPDHVEYAAIECSVSRVIVNQPAGTTGGGSPTNGFTPTTTLGCGSWGNNSFSGNFNYEHLMNITRVGYPYEESYLPAPELVWQED
ncbi:MAG: aldehyde dehydrogenase family protein [Lachnoclostridium edouardi]|uniref:aldehyde dehydrogenase family protein n=1 Tax=Lachnoclostridium edouardi TaxID=1926283 RepID=UPI0026DB154D|nr:aldehyde dehydrogenase family protein [Lachnoclostridium edouardi]MDO4278778.1 aldehyde dehydrogenase family protein [Lachnoclostridium edouardi]